MTDTPPRPELNVQTWVYITFDGKSRKLFWYKIGTDGSIYIGLAEKPKYVVGGRMQTEDFLSGAATTGKFLLAQKPLNVTKISFHPSGKIHQDFQNRIINENFWDVNDRRLLVLMLFRDTRKIAVAARNKDFTRPSVRIDANEFGFHEDHILQCAVMLRPVLDNELEPIDEAPHVQWAAIYRNFTEKRKKPMIVHFLLIGKAPNKEPLDHTFFIYPNTSIVLGR
jgi:hypothetical protein